MAKYCQSQIHKRGPIGAITHRPDDSPIWTDLLKIKYFYMRNRKVKVNNGQSTLFWEEPWLKEKPLCILHPVLYDLCLDKKISIHSVLIRGSSKFLQMASHNTFRFLVFCY